MSIDETTDHERIDPSIGTRTEPQNVMIPVDGSRRAARAILPGRRLAAALGLPVGVMTVSRPRSEPDQSMLESVVADQRLHWSTTVRSEHVAEGISTCAREHDAIVSMATGGRGRSAAIVGSTAVDVVKHSMQPVMLVGPGTEVFERRPITELVVAVSGDASDQAICEEAAGLATTYGFALHVVTVVQPTPAPADGEPRSDRSFGPAGDEHEYVDRLVRLVEGLTACGSDVAGSVIRDPLSPAGGLAQMMRWRPQSLLVIGTSSRSGLDRLRRGSVSSNIVSASPVPSIVLPLAASSWVGGRTICGARITT